MDIKDEIRKVIQEFGVNPMEFFWILHDSNNNHINFEKQNEAWAFIKSETWHSLNLTNYYLWAISDNGDLLWWNGKQVIAMAPKDSEFMSIPVRPLQFISLLKSGHSFSLFPDDL